MKIYELVVYVPATHSEKVKSALFAAGAGKLGNYDCCCFSVPGTGEFRPLAGSRPFAGRAGVAAKVPEVRLEMICREEVLRGVLDALKQAHPYETPAFHFFAVETA